MGKSPNEELLARLEDRVNPGVDDAALVKAKFLDKIVKKESTCTLISPQHALKLLGTMLGGYNVSPLVEALKSTDDTIAQGACDALKNIILVYEKFNDVEELAKTNKYAKEVLT